MMPKKTENAEVERRRDDALRRALNTPPKPKTSGKDDRGRSKKEKGEEDKG